MTDEGHKFQLARFAFAAATLASTSRTSIVPPYSR